MSLKHKSGEWPNIERPTCEHCGHPEAVQEDYDKYAEGDGEHLCWGDPFVCAEFAKERSAHATVSWDDFATWLRRVDIHVRALETGDLDAGQVASIANALRGDVDAAMVVNGVKREDA